MIQDIFPHRFNNSYLAGTVAGATDFVLYYRGNSLLLKASGEELYLPQRSDFPNATGNTEMTFLFSFNDIPCFLMGNEPELMDPNLVYKEISFFRTARQPEIAWISLVGLHLSNWYAQNRFCGKCGTKTQQKPDERAVMCPACHSVFFPKISPAIIVAITCRDKILLARNTNFAGGWYSLVAGYVDIGETLEETVIREVKEEVGLDVRKIRYYTSQPWPLSGSVMIGFTAEADDNQPIVTDNKEIAEAGWFTRGKLPNHPLTISIAGEMIEKFEKGEL
jgi:NAD+ diphosphatase